MTVWLQTSVRFVLRRKHRVRRTMGQGEKRDLQQRIQIELENMAHLSRPYLTEVKRATSYRHDNRFRS